jgi:hypothetical protein
MMAAVSLLGTPSFFSRDFGSFFAECSASLFRQVRDRSLPLRGFSCCLDVSLRSDALFPGSHVLMKICWLTDIVSQIDISHSRLCRRLDARLDRSCMTSRQRPETHNSARFLRAGRLDRVQHRIRTFRLLLPKMLMESAVSRSAQARQHLLESPCQPVPAKASA